MRHKNGTQVTLLNEDVPNDDLIDKKYLLRLHAASEMCFTDDMPGSWGCFSKYTCGGFYESSGTTLNQVGQLRFQCHIVLRNANVQLVERLLENDQPR